MLDRRLYAEVTDRLENIPAVAILGPRQAGKTTLILKLADQRPSLYLDLKLDTDREVRMGVQLLWSVSFCAVLVSAIYFGSTGLVSKWITS